MKNKLITSLYTGGLLLVCLGGKLSYGQSFDVFIANDSATSSTTYEFDVNLRNTDTSSWAFRTIQLAFYVNPAWLPAGASPTITFIPGSSTLANYSPGIIQMNAGPNSLSAFQVATNLAGSCGAGTVFSSNGQTEKVGRFSIESNSGPMNCVPCNLSMIRPGLVDSTPGSNIVLKMAVSKWTSVNCSPGTSTIISANGTYTSLAGSTLLNDFRNMAPFVSAPSDTIASDCTPATFTVQATGIAGQTTPLLFQWFENGNPLSDNSIYSGVNTNQLTITNPPLSLNGNTYFAGVSQCIGNSSPSAVLSVTSCTGTAELQNLKLLDVFPNPSNGKIFIKCESVDKPVSVEIVNLLNQVVRKKENIIFNNTLSEQVEMNLSKGMYILKCTFATGIVEKKLVIN